jgi:uncharacterized protein YuzE
MMKPYVKYFPDTNSMFLVLDDDHGQTESEEVAENVIAIFNESDNRLVAIEILNGARELFADLLTTVGKPTRAKSVKSA